MPIEAVIEPELKIVDAVEEDEEKYEKIDEVLDETNRPVDVEPEKSKRKGRVSQKDRIDSLESAVGEMAQMLGKFMEWQGKAKRGEVEPPRLHDPDLDPTIGLDERLDAGWEFVTITEAYKLSPHKPVLDRVDAAFKKMKEQIARQANRYMQGGDDKRTALGKAVSEGPSVMRVNRAFVDKNMFHSLRTNRTWGGGSGEPVMSIVIDGEVQDDRPGFIFEYAFTE